MKTFCKTVAWLLLVLLVVGIVAFVWVRTDGGNEELKTFELRHDGETIVQATSTAEFAVDSTERYDVGYLLDTSKEPRDYSVKIVANGAEDFTYRSGETSCSWKSTKEDFSAYFGLVKFSDHFTLQIPATYSLERAIGSVYGTSIEQVTADRAAPLFTLVVSSYNEKYTYRIHFSVKTPEVDEDVTYNISHEVVGGTDGNIMFECPETAHPGETVVFTLQTPATYSLLGVRLRKGDGSEIAISAEGNPYSHKYSFVMPKEDVTLVIKIEAVFG